MAKNRPPLFLRTLGVHRPGNRVVRGLGEFSKIQVAFLVRHLSPLPPPPPQSQKDDFYFDSIGRALKVYGSMYDKILLADDVNAEINMSIMTDFVEFYNLGCLLKDKTCFKSLLNPSCIDLFLTNCPRSLQHTT